MATVDLGPYPDDWDQCIMCNFNTPYWWGDGCAPLCKTCAKRYTDSEVHKKCKRQGYGPLPEEPPKD